MAFAAGGAGATPAWGSWALILFLILILLFFGIGFFFPGFVKP